MLLIAIPKSASSSLLSTLVSIHDLEDETRDGHLLLGQCEVASGYKPLSKMHPNDFVEVNDTFKNFLTHHDNKTILKHHIPPTENNVRMLRDHKKVVLLRDPEEVIGAYKRGDESGAYVLKDPRFAFCFTYKGWLNKAKQVGVIDSLENFCSDWLKDDVENLIIYHDELVSRPKETVNKIEEFLNLPLSTSVTLAHTRYSRGEAIDRNKVNKFLKLVWSRRRLYVQILTKVFTSTKKLNPYSLISMVLLKIKYLILRFKYINKPYREYYKAVMSLKIRQDPRSAVGGMWNVMGPKQLDFLVSNGLEPQHKLLDIGCGSLRGGLHFIDYLQRGNYYGIDISSEILEAGKIFLKEEGLEYKKPSLKIINNLDFDEFKGVTFDFIYAQSVLSHMPKKDVVELLKNIHKVMNDKSVFLATFFIGETYRSKNESRNFYYPFDMLYKIGKAYDLNIELLGSDDHPRKQRTMKITTL